MSRIMLAALAPLFFLAAPAAAQEAAYVPQPGSIGAATNAELPPPDTISKPGPRKKGWVIEVDQSVAVPFSLSLTKTIGYVADLRLGYRFPVAGPMWISPEGDLGWVQFPKWEGALRYGGGARVGLDMGRLEPSVYLYGGGFWNVWKSGWGLRAGGALDVRVLSFLRPGVHAEYDVGGWSDAGQIEFASFGAHLGFVL